METKEINTSMREIGEAFKNFKSSQERRVGRLETLLRRPTKGPLEESGETSHKEAFLNYLRKGSESEIREAEQKSLSSASDPEGGFLIPELISSHIIKTLETHSPIRDLARVTTISTDAVEFLIDKESLDVGWVAEQEARPETGTPDLARLKISVHEMYAKPRATQKLLDDASLNVEEWLVGKISEQMVRLENKAFLHGDGDGKPKGILSYESGENWGCLQEIKSGSNGSIGEKQGDLFIETVHALKPGYLKNAVWMMSRACHEQVWKLKDEHTGNYLWRPGIAENAPDTLLGYPVILSEDMPSPVEGDPAKAILFGNFYEGYQIVDRTGIRVLRDPYSAKPYVEFYATKRTGSAVTNFDAIKVVNLSE